MINAAHFSFVPYAEFEDASGNLCAENLYWVEPGAKFTYRVPAHVHVTSDAHLSKTAFIAFGPAEAFSRAQVGPTLISCSQAVIAALDALVKAYIKSLPAPERP